MSVYVNHMKGKIIPVIRYYHLYVTVSLKGEGSLTESTASMDYTKSESVKAVESALDKQVTDSMVHLISRVQREYHTHIFNFDAATHNRYSFMWPSFKKTLMTLRDAGYDENGHGYFVCEESRIMEWNPISS